MRRLVLLVTVVCLGQQQPPAGPRILRPNEGAVIRPGPLSVIAKTAGKGELRLDGKPVAATEPGPGALTGAISPAPGPHELTLITPAGEQKIKFVVGAPQGKEYRAHPPAAVGCNTCHAVQEGVWSVKGESLAANCFICHDQKVFALPHSHNPQVLNECQMCHDPHGSSEKFHLKMPKETACKICHG